MQAFSLDASFVRVNQVGVECDSEDTEIRVSISLLLVLELLLSRTMSGGRSAIESSRMFESLGRLKERGARVFEVPWFRGSKFLLIMTTVSPTAIT